MACSIVETTFVNAMLVWLKTCNEVNRITNVINGNRFINLLGSAAYEMVLRSLVQEYNQNRAQYGNFHVTMKNQPRTLCATPDLYFYDWGPASRWSRWFV